ncbi:uncharacterized protein [Spinacia oleracea]|uniref:Reverse transcriptase domain-containing protein n=1 Tax=Spinacia oleracea TaxID=3562 RepID=A0A9R0I229_SPIOL|nr:uncharacterized protein LOC110781245 [Spinacia oleracea]
MIPKIASPEEVHHLLPISLCNTVYKCASKCLVNRLKVNLNALIDEKQHAFIPGRYMSDNILLSHDILHFINRRKVSGPTLAAVKIDMSKAYDRIHWGFLLRVLKAYGFPSIWIQLIYQCISTVSYKVLINGKTSTAFRPKCGLRQGDSLSPYLFLFCMDILGRMLTLGQDIKLFQGIKLARQAPKVTHLFFADDAMVFFRSNETSCASIGGILDRYCRISGQQLNLAKSFIKFSPNTSLPDQQLFKSILRMPQVVKFGNHLGVPIDLIGSRRSHFNYLIDKVAELIISWNGVLLSQAQKLVLINTVLVATVSHVMMSLEIPGAVASKIDSMIATFFWAKQGQKGMHWVRRDILQLPRGMGGLGIRRLSTLNTTFLMKQVWRMHKNPQLLISKVYAAKTNFALSSGSPNICHGPISWGMRGLRRAENVLQRGCAWKIGDGRKVRVSSDKWVHGRVPVLASNIRLMDAKVWKVSHFIQNPSLCWNATLIRNSFEHKDANEILSVELPSCPTSDFVYWTKHKTCNFTLKSGYAFLREIDMQQHPLNYLDRKRFLPFFKLLWALKILSKWKLLLWKLILNGIPVKTNLERRGIILDTKCDFSEEYCEDAQHIFRLCKLAQDVWRSSMLGILSNINESLSMQDWILNYIQLFISLDGKFSDRVVTFIAMLWAIWITRNERVFRSNAGDITVFQIQFKLALEQHNVFRGKDDGKLGFLHPPEHKQDYPPGFYFANIGMEITLPTSTTVILIDGAWNKDTFRAGMGWVLKQRQSDEMEILGGCDYGLGNSALHVEAMACLRAFTMGNGVIL